MPSPQALLNGPQYWGTNMPQPGDYNGDLPAYLAAVKAYHDNATWNQPAWAAPSDMSSMGAGWHAAGVTTPPTLGNYGAQNFLTAFNMGHQPGVHGAFNPLVARAGVHPDEAQNAYDTFKVDPKTGLPVAALPDDVLVALESLGYRPSIQKPSNLGPMQTDPNYVRDQAAKNQAAIDKQKRAPGATGGSGTGGPGPTSTPNADNLWQNFNPGVVAMQPPPKSGDHRSGPVEQPGAQQDMTPQQHAQLTNHNYPPAFLRDLEALRQRHFGPMTQNLGY